MFQSLLCGAHRTVNACARNERLRHVMLEKVSQRKVLWKLGFFWPQEFPTISYKLPKLLQRRINVHSKWLFELGSHVCSCNQASTSEKTESLKLQPICTEVLSLGYQMNQDLVYFSDFPVKYPSELISLFCEIWIWLYNPLYTRNFLSNHHLLVPSQWSSSCKFWNLQL